MRESVKKFIFASFINLFTLGILFSQDTASENSLLILPDDIVITEEKNPGTNEVTGYHLYIKKKPGVESVMLTETTKDPSGQNPNYAYRAKEYNPVNGDEIRILNGEQLDFHNAQYSLIDSTTEKNEYFDECFHIYIPDEIVFGYPWSRNGTVKISKGTFINIRSFEKKYCDYTGKYFDNPYMFDFEIRKRKKTELKTETHELKKLEEKAVPVEEEKTILTDNYNPLAAQTFKEISEMMIYSKGPETIIEDIMNSIKMINPKDKADIVFAIDATGSMKDDIQKLKEKWLPALVEGLKEFNDVRLGLVFYRDYGDNFFANGLPVKYYDFTSDVQAFVKNVRSLRIIGSEGGDIPEAVYEALYASMEFFKWRADASKKVILIGDAEPHNVPRKTGKYSKQLIEKLSKEKQIEINAIITPDDKERRGRS
ncbi:MAG: vWA domain-containing protein [Treponema sp.]